MKCDVYACQVGDHEFFPHAHALSTAQGGGGSFKDRKLIGEVSCCHAWMAGPNQLLDRHVAGGSAV